MILSVPFILAAMHLHKMLWDELIKTAAYLENWSVEIIAIIPYELENRICLNISHLKVVSSYVWMHILKKKKRVKLDICFCQEIFIEYEDTNQY